MGARSMKEIKQLSKSELETKRKSLEKDLLEARFALSLGQLSDRAKVWRLRKDLARVHGLCSEKTKSN